jgi:AcrR family transcriptional regulator
VTASANHKPPARWLKSERAELAAQRILDAAGELFRERGVEKVRMEHVAKQAGCSRGTLYRYFPTREALRLAYIQRASLRLHREVAEHVAPLRNTEDILVASLVFALREVRADPSLAAWFEPDALGTMSTLAGSTDVVFQMSAAFFKATLERAEAHGGLRAGLDHADAAEWLVRALLSMLTVNGPRQRTAKQEAAYLREFLMPAVMSR